MGLNKEENWHYKNKLKISYNTTKASVRLGKGGLRNAKTAGLDYVRG